MQGRTNECMNKWNNKLMFVPLSLPLPLSLHLLKGAFLPVSGKVQSEKQNQYETDYQELTLRDCGGWQGKSKVWRSGYHEGLAGHLRHKPKLLLTGGISSVLLLSPFN